MTTETYADTTQHACYFCRPDLYPPMPEFHTLCARCGDLILTDVRRDPGNHRLEVCPKCDHELWQEIR